MLKGIRHITSKRPFKLVVIISLIIATLSSAYLLLLIAYPLLSQKLDNTAVVVPESYQVVDLLAQGKLDQPRVMIPAISLNEKIYVEDDGLDKGVWLKYANATNPETGGNIILTGHRFNFGLTPDLTKRKSPFYHITDLKPGDPIYIFWNNKRYEYQVKELKKVSPYAVEIEEDTPETQLTIYTCTLGGRYDGREVIIATEIK
jgi:LPXTG-site transpeptidase (sortase) family protein